MSAENNEDLEKVNSNSEVTSVDSLLRIKSISEINTISGSKEVDENDATTEAPTSTSTNNSNGFKTLKRKPTWDISDKETSENAALSSEENDPEKLENENTPKRLKPIDSADNNNEEEKKPNIVDAPSQIDVSEVVDKKEIKTENGDSSSAPTKIKLLPPSSVVKTEASSSSRESCKYGIRCYRQNPMHRIKEAHPGDVDYTRPSHVKPPEGTPDCPFGNSCYRRNPCHFQKYKHPEDTDFKANYAKYWLRKRQQKIKTDDDSDEHDSDDPFLDDGTDSEFCPSDFEDDA